MKPNHEHNEYINGLERDYLCLFRRDTAGGYRVTCPEVPGMVACGESLDEVRENVREELAAWFETSDFRDDPFRELRREWRPSIGP